MLQPKLTEVTPLEDLRLRLVYETGEMRIFDVAPYVQGSWFSQLADPAYFNSVRLLPNGAGIEWAQGHDIAPHELYEQSIDL